MVDPNIKKLRIPITDMPPISSISEGHNVRYRIVSEDRNRSSHWSPVFLIKPEYTFVPTGIRYSSGGGLSSISWDSVIILKSLTSITSINNKQLQTNIATLTTDGAHYMVVGDWVTVEDVDSTFDGTYKISSVTTNTFSYYKDHGNIASTPVSPKGTYKTNAFIRNAVEYDVWIRWDRNDGGDWLYKERIEGTTASFPIPSTYTKNGAVQSNSPNRFSAEIYLKGYPIGRGDGIPLASGTPFLKVYQVLNQTA
jgi:hypothetical protein